MVEPVQLHEGAERTTRRRRSEAARARSPCSSLAGCGGGPERRRARRRGRRGRRGGAARRRALRAHLPPLRLQGRRRGALPRHRRRLRARQHRLAETRRVLDYYELDGDRTREGGLWVLHPDQPARFGRCRSPPPAAGSARSSRARTRAAVRRTPSICGSPWRAIDDDRPTTARGSAARSTRPTSGPRPQARRVPGAARAPCSAPGSRCSRSSGSSGRSRRRSTGPRSWPSRCC